MGSKIKEKIKTVAKKYAYNHEGFRKWAKKVNYTYESKKYDIGNRKAVTDDHLIYFNTFNGRSYADSPKAIYLQMLKDERFRNYRFVWMFRDPEKYRFLEDNPNTTVVKFESRDEVDAIRKAKYWITNYRMLEKYRPRNDQIYVQCWHGTPLKRLGFDITESDNAMNTREEIREKYQRDTERFTYFISPSGFASEAFKSAWNMKAMGKEDAIIEEGYPRNDRLFNYSDEELEEIRRSIGIAGTEKKVLLYVPTWRDNQFDAESGKDYAYRTEMDFDYMQKMLGYGFVILFRAHYLVSSKFDFEKYRGFVYDVSGYDDINDLFLVSDMLITDYSSAFFDYANLEKPILFYMYDFDYYRNKLRGFYLDIDTLPGPIVKRELPLAAEIIKMKNGFKPGEKYWGFNERFNKLDDGHATERVIEKIFFEGRETQHEQ